MKTTEKDQNAWREGGEGGYPLLSDVAKKKPKKKKKNTHTQKTGPVYKISISPRY